MKIAIIWWGVCYFMWFLSLLFFLVYVFLLTLTPSVFLPRLLSNFLCSKRTFYSNHDIFKDLIYYRSVVVIGRSVDDGWCVGFSVVSLDDEVAADDAPESDLSEDCDGDEWRLLFLYFLEFQWFPVSICPSSGSRCIHKCESQ